MASYLIAKGNKTYSYAMTSTCNKPRMQIASAGKTSYIPMATTTTNTSQVRISSNGSSYRLMSYSNTSSSSSTSTTSSRTSTSSYSGTSNTITQQNTTKTISAYSLKSGTGIYNGAQKTCYTGSITKYFTNMANTYSYRDLDQWGAGNGTLSVWSSTTASVLMGQSIDGAIYDAGYDSGQTVYVFNQMTQTWTHLYYFGVSTSITYLYNAQSYSLSSVYQKADSVTPYSYMHAYVYISGYMKGSTKTSLTSAAINGAISVPLTRSSQYNTSKSASTTTTTYK